MTTPPELEKLADQVASQVKAEFIAMMTSNKEGEIVTVIGFNETKVFAQPKELVWRRKLERGHWAVIKPAR